MADANTNNTVFRSVLDRILDIDLGPADPAKQQYNAFFDEIVSRCVADVAGMMQTGAKNMPGRRTPGANERPEASGEAGLAQAFHTFSERYGEDSARTLMVRYLPEVPDTMGTKAVLKALGEKYGNESARDIIARNTPDTRPGADLKLMFNGLEERYGEKNARDLILRNVPGYTKRLVHTPHPTELLNEAAIEAQERVVKALIKLPKLFVQQESNGRRPSRTAKDPAYIIPTDIRGELHEALGDLRRAINDPVSKPLTIDQEMRRSIRFSQREFDSIPGIADTVMDATRIDSAKLGFDELRLFGHLIGPETWSPGDQDSKPDMTAEKLQKGANLSRRAMMFHYYRTLAVLGSNSDGLVSEDTKLEIQKMMHKLLKAGCESYDTPITPTLEVAKQKLSGVSESGSASEYFAKSYAQFKDNSFIRGFEDNFNTTAQQTEAYKNVDDFLKDLKRLRPEPLSAAGGNAAPESLSPGRGIERIKEDKRKRINSLDSLIIQAMNFGDSALRIQIRQNAEVHENSINALLSLVPKDTLPAGVEVIIPPPKEDEERRKEHEARREGGSDRIERLIDAFTANPDFAAGVKTGVARELGRVQAKLDAFNERFRGEYAAKDAQKDAEKTQRLGQLEQIKETSLPLYKVELLKLNADLADYETKKEKARQEKLHEFIKDDLGNGDGKAGKAAYAFYQNMESLGFAARNPDRVPRYLIAECRSKTDMLEAFFLLKVMESLGPKSEKKVEIVNLVEHPDLAEDRGNGIITAKMSTGALENKQFFEHHKNIASSMNLLTDYSLEKGSHRISVAEAKRTFGLTPKKDDEKRDVMGVKMMMGAGSDITKAGGVAAAAAMMDAIEKTREALLDQKGPDNKPYPMLLEDYIGVGGGIHRTQPVSTGTETVQGNTMRQSPENIAQKVLGLLSDFLHRKLAMNPTLGSETESYLGRHMSRQERIQMCRTNMSNMAHLDKNDAIWNTHTRGRTYAMMDKYEKLYESKEFTDLMSYSADMYANLTKFAARPGNREGSKIKKTGFLAPVDVKETRAIGFGAALNAAGICAPMFFGGSEYLSDTMRPDTEYLKKSGMDDAKIRKALDDSSDETLMKMYMYDPKAQDTINRMTYGVIMADMDVAWTYLGRSHAPSVVELKVMASQKTSDDDTRANAEKCLSQINLEYNNVAGRLLRLHKSVISGLPPAEPSTETLDGKKAARELLATLPSALREQLDFSTRNIEKPRQALASLFDKMGKGEVDPASVKLDSPEYKQTVYPAMGAIFECFEHAPRAYTRPLWVKATEPQQQQRVA